MKNDAHKAIAGLAWICLAAGVIGLIGALILTGTSDPDSNERALAAFIAGPSWTLVVVSIIVAGIGFAVSAIRHYLAPIDQR